MLISSGGFTEINGGILSSSEISVTSDSISVKGLGVITEDNLILKSGKNVELYSGLKH